MEFATCDQNKLKNGENTEIRKVSFSNALLMSRFPKNATGPRKETTVSEVYFKMGFARFDCPYNLELHSEKFFAFGCERVSSSQVRGLHRAEMLCVLRFFFNLVSDISSRLAGAYDKSDSDSESESVVSIFFTFKLVKACHRHFKRGLIESGLLAMM